MDTSGIKTDYYNIEYELEIFPLVIPRLCFRATGTQVRRQSSLSLLQHAHFQPKREWWGYNRRYSTLFSEGIFNNCYL